MLYDYSMWVQSSGTSKQGGRKVIGGIRKRKYGRFENPRLTVAATIDDKVDSPEIPAKSEDPATVATTSSGPSREHACYGHCESGISWTKNAQRIAKATTNKASGPKR